MSFVSVKKGLGYFCVFDCNTCLLEQSKKRHIITSAFSLQIARDLYKFHLRVALLKVLLKLFHFPNLNQILRMPIRGILRIRIIYRDESKYLAVQIIQTVNHLCHGRKFEKYCITKQCIQNGVWLTLEENVEIFFCLRLFYLFFCYSSSFCI